MRLRLAFALAFCVLTAGAQAAEIKPFVRGSWKEIRQAHGGKPLVVHFWGVTCAPCRTELPLWGKFLKERADLKLVLIDADLIPNEPRAANAMLQKAGLSDAESWLFSDDFVERLRFEVDPQWQGEIPRTLLVARDGTTTTMEGVADFAQLRAWLDSQRD